MAIYYNTEVGVGGDLGDGIHFVSAQSNVGQKIIYNEPPTLSLSGSGITIFWNDTVGLNGVHSMSGVATVDGRTGFGNVFGIHMRDKQTFTFTVSAQAANTTQKVILTPVGRTILSRTDIRKTLLGY
jgi:hypothetical protein